MVRVPPVGVVRLAVAPVVVPVAAPPVAVRLPVPALPACPWASSLPWASKRRLWSRGWGPGWRGHAPSSGSDECESVQGQRAAGLAVE